MKKAKALQDFNYGREVILKGDILESHVTTSWYFRIGNSFIPAFIVERNPHIFQCPYEEKLTSDQWDEKARGYGYFIPRDGERYYYANPITMSIHPSNWYDDNSDMSFLRAGLAFETREEAEKLLEKLKKEKQL